MELKRVVPKMEETFGELIFAGEGKVEKAGFGGNGKVTGRIFNLYSSKQRADNIAVKLVGNVGEHNFTYMDKVKLINPRLIVEGKKAGDTGYSDYTLLADDMEKIQ